jgi:hypothetical protein
MAKCPDCGKEIDHVVFWEQFSKYEDVNLVDGKLVYSEPETEHDDQSFVCPECGDDIFDDVNEVIKFLKGGEEDGTASKEN